jgi:hypothetical protein
MNVLGTQIVNRKWSYLAFTLALVFFAYYLFVQILTIQYAPDMVILTDTNGYIEVAKAPILSREFLAGGRPLTLPLVYKLFHSDLSTIAWIQWFFSAFSWSILAVFVYRAVNHKILKIPAFVLILVFSMSDEIIVWNQVALSESLHLSLFALFVACWLWLLERFSWYKTALLLITTFFWIFTREENALLALIISVFLLIAAFKNWRYLVIAIFLILFYRADTLSSNMGGRWKAVVINIIEDRILTSEHYDIFMHSGMPITPEYLEYGIPNEFEFNPIRYDPEFLSWLDQKGKKIYIHYLRIVDPLERIEEAFGALPIMVSPYVTRYSPEFTTILPGKISEIVFPRDYPLIIILASAFGSGLALLWVRKLIIPFGLLSLIFPLAFIIFHGDSNEIERHGIVIAVQSRLGLWLLLFFASDHLVTYMVSQKDRIQTFFQITLLERIRRVWQYLNDHRAVAGPTLTVIGLAIVIMSVILDILGPSRSISLSEIGYAQGLGILLGAITISIGFILRQEPSNNEPDKDGSQA